MLEREDPVENERRHLDPGRENTEDSAGFFHGCSYSATRAPPRVTQHHSPVRALRSAIQPTGSLQTVIDLHSHSVLSDGSETPERVVELAGSAGCTAVALTDHDGLDGVPAAAAAARSFGIRLIPGCEVSCAWSGGSLHVLCYFIEPGTGPLQSELVRLREDRDRRNLRLVERLRELGVDLSYEEVEREAGGTGIGRPHFAAVLVRHGAASSAQDAFDRWLGTGRPAYLSKARVEPGAIASLAKASGGLAVLAHPLSLGLEPGDLDRQVAALAEAGFEGLECYYGRYDEDTRRELVALARRHGLVPTGGSDFHGSYKPDLSMGTGTGDLSVPDEVVAELESRLPCQPGESPTPGPG